jgi:hypothetical protein
MVFLLSVGFRVEAVIGPRFNPLQPLCQIFEKSKK